MLGYKTYTLSSSKDWVVFLHGVGGSQSLFYKQIKPFKKHFNILLIDFPGHGKSATLQGEYTFEKVAMKIFEVMDHLKIKKAHVAGISLGTIIMNEMCRIAPHRISSMILGGAVIKWKTWTDILFKLAFMVKGLLPYMFLYKTFALIMMPRKNHRDSRMFFVKEASKVGRKEFMKWANLLMGTKKVYQSLLSEKNTVPKLLIMGDEDHIFLRGAQHYVEKDHYATLIVLNKCGHVCNIDRTEEFNEETINFITENITENIYSKTDETTA